jgi:hypothetical protein
MRLPCGVNPWQSTAAMSVSAVVLMLSPAVDAVFVAVLSALLLLLLLLPLS